MKVAKKSPPKHRQKISAPRTTLTLPTAAYRALDEIRGSLPRSACVEQLIAEEKRRQDDRQFFAQASAQYTPAVCRETLRINATFPIHGDL